MLTEQVWKLNMEYEVLVIEVTVKYLFCLLVLHIWRMVAEDVTQI